MNNLNTHQRKLMDWLLTKPQGGTLDELAGLLGVTRTACKQQVLRLLDLGYLSFQDSKGDVGRPKRRYLVSPEGMDVFPKQYSWLSNALLDAEVDVAQEVRLPGRRDERVGPAAGQLGPTRLPVAHGAQGGHVVGEELEVGRGADADDVGPFLEGLAQLPEAQIGEVLLAANGDQGQGGHHFFSV
jgi:hypothetical protein